MLNLRENFSHSDEITSLYQVAAAPPQPTPIRRAAACGGVAPAARGPGAAAPSRACAGAGCRGAALAVCACPRGRARCPPPGGLRAPLPAAPQSGAAAGLCGASAAAAASRSVPRGAGPPAPLPHRRSLRPARPRAAALRFGRGRPRSARACFSPAPFPGLGRRFGRCGRCAACSLPCSRGAPPPVAASPVARAGAARCPPRPLVPASLRPRGLRRVVPAPRRPAPVAAARLRLGAAPPCQGPAAAGPGGRAAAGGAPGPAAAGPVLGRSRAPRVGLGFRRCGGGSCAALRVLVACGASRVAAPAA